MHIPFDEGQPLGIVDEFSIDRQQVTIPKGGLMLLFNDGLHEVIDRAGNPFGFDRIKAVLSADRHLSAQTICQNLWLAVHNHSGELIHQDDFTTVVIKRNKE